METTARINTETILDQVIEQLLSQYIEAKTELGKHHSVPHHTGKTASSYDNGNSGMLARAFDAHRATTPEEKAFIITAGSLIVTLTILANAINKRDSNSPLAQVAVKTILRQIHALHSIGIRPLSDAVCSLKLKTATTLGIRQTANTPQDKGDFKDTPAHGGRQIVQDGKTYTSDPPW